MSFFYLNPVKGEIPVHMLETILLKRIDFLKRLVETNSIEYNEYVVEDSGYDNVGHFMMCLVSKLADNTGFSKLIFKGEALLFKSRLNKITSYGLRTFSKKIMRCLKKKEKLYPSEVPLQVICQHLMIKFLAQHLCSQSHSSFCCDHTIGLPFKFCLPFLGKRLVNLKKGIAYLSCGLWKQFLEILFTKQLTQRFHMTNFSQLKSDPRIMELLNKINMEPFPYLFSCSNSLLRYKQVDGISKLFPPCMLNLHQQLRDKHRLSHSQRFYYSLFLKDIGLPVEEAVEFWREEYRLAPNGSKCCHSWEKDEKKFLYGIRHMYGLEGAKKNYTSVNCSSIQNLGSCTEGGCPFKSFEIDKMKKCLQYEDESFLSQINELRKMKKYSKACSHYLNKWKPSENFDYVTFNLTPVNFYLAVSKYKS